MGLRIGEFGLIERIKGLVERPSTGLVLGIEDDAAAFQTTEDQINLLTTDAFIEGVHFNLDYFSFHQLGWRVMAANLSDIAAMGGWPHYVVISVGLPADMTKESIDDFYGGMKALADQYETALIGGDTVESPERLFISLTIFGRVEQTKMAKRSGAQIGDAIFVTGHLGGAAAGLKVLQSDDSPLKKRFVASVDKHLTPNPRIREARFLVENFPVNAMIDISDGLAPGLHHVCDLSKVGALIDETAIPILEETRSVARHFNEKSLDYALFGGEDFELLFTAADDGSKIMKKFVDEFGYSCFHIGRIRDKSQSLALQGSCGEETFLDPQGGFQHFSES